MTRFLVAPDGHGDDTIWVADRHVDRFGELLPVAVMSRSQFAHVPDLWAEIVQRMTVEPADNWKASE